MIRLALRKTLSYYSFHHLYSTDLLNSDYYLLSYFAVVELVFDDDAEVEFAAVEIFDVDAEDCV